MSVYISLGSNLGDPGANIQQALDAVGALPDVRVVRVSPLYRTEPQGIKAQPWFVNVAAELDCGAGWTPPALMRSLLDVEARMGRVRYKDPAMRTGPRCIDIDILLFRDVVSDDPVCRLPHPRMFERAFVLVPLHDIAPAVRLPHGLTLQEALQRLQYSVQDDVIFQS